MSIVRLVTLVYITASTLVTQELVAACMADTIVLFETQDSLTKNLKLILDAVAWLKDQRPEIEVKIVTLPYSMRNPREN